MRKLLLSPPQKDQLLRRARGIKKSGVIMKRSSITLFVLLSLTLPVAGTCADAPANAPKAGQAGASETTGSGSPPAKTSAAPAG